MINSACEKCDGSEENCALVFGVTSSRYIITKVNKLRAIWLIVLFIYGITGFVLYFIF